MVREIQRRHRDAEQPCTHPSLPAQFPPLRSLDASSNNLPAQLTSFVGREAERAVLRKLLRETRLLTLLGPGGAGKTRLAIEFGRELLDDVPDGVWFVDLSGVAQERLVPSAILAGVALFAFGTGPVKGFAVSLIVGILTSMYTAVSVSRGLATLIYGHRRKLKSIAV